MDELTILLTYLKKELLKKNYDTYILLKNIVSLCDILTDEEIPTEEKENFRARLNNFAERIAD